MNIPEAEQENCTDIIYVIYDVIENKLDIRTYNFQLKAG